MIQLNQEKLTIWISHPDFDSGSEFCILRKTEVHQTERGGETNDWEPATTGIDQNRGYRGNQFPVTSSPLPPSHRNEDFGGSQSLGIIAPKGEDWERRPTHTDYQRTTGEECRKASVWGHSDTNFFFIVTGLYCVTARPTKRGA